MATVKLFTMAVILALDKKKLIALLVRATGLGSQGQEAQASLWRRSTIIRRGLN
jgi:hypothetical protein